MKTDMSNVDGAYYHPHVADHVDYGNNTYDGHRSQEEQFIFKWAY